MKAIIRDDIIALESFVAAEFKYKYYLETLMKSGNYCFLDQFKRFIKNGQAIVNGMIEYNLLALENINKNYKYIYLTDTAMKYLYLRDSEEDFSEVKKNRISVKKVDKNPTEKQLLSSAYKFHLLIHGEDLIDKESILKSIEDMIFIKNHKGNRSSYKSWINARGKEIEEYNENIEKVKEKESTLLEHLNLIKSGSNLLNPSEDLKKYKGLESKIKEIENEIQERSQKLIKGVLKGGVKELNLELEYLNKLKDEAYNLYSLKNKLLKNVEDVRSNFKSLIQKEEKQLNETQVKIESMNNAIKNKTIPEVEKVQKVFENLYNISKVIARIKDNTLEFIILDTGNFKTAFGYLKQINSIKELNIDLQEIKITIYSYAEHRAFNLYNEFIKAKTEKEKALNTMKAFNKKTENANKKPDFYIAAKKIYDNTPDFDVEYKGTFFYMKGYMSVISSGNKSIKRKDKEAIDNLIEKLKNKD